MFGINFAFFFGQLLWCKWDCKQAVVCVWNLSCRLCPNNSQLEVHPHTLFGPRAEFQFDFTLRCLWAQLHHSSTLFESLKPHTAQATNCRHLMACKLWKLSLVLSLHRNPTNLYNSFPCYLSLPLQVCFNPKLSAWNIGITDGQVSFEWGFNVICMNYVTSLAFSTYFVRSVGVASLLWGGCDMLWCCEQTNLVSVYAINQI